MEALKEILLAHAAKYPQMQPTDGVKLIYQNEFGGGHMIRDRESCMAYLRREYASVEKNTAAVRSESIGNGILRIHLAALEEAELDALGDAFITSANAHQGSLSRFLEKLALLTTLAKEGALPFSEAELAEHLAEYEKHGYPPVSHSDAYRSAYHPAYRIVKEEYWLRR